MFAFLFTTVVVMSVVASEETSCELHDLKTLFFRLITTKKDLETVIEESKKLVLEEVKQIKHNITDLRDQVAEISGEWSSWSNWTECPVTCLGGLTRRNRTCNNPVTSKPGRCCVGNNEEVAICNSFMCPDVDDCVGHTCKNGATCVDGVYNYTCNCAVGFTGKDCGTDIDDCVGHTCKNGATCVDGVYNYTCNCAVGFTGKDCGTSRYYGTNFIMGFMKNHITTSVPTLLVACLESTAVVTVSIPALNISNERHNLTGNTLNLTFPSTIVSMTPGKIENNGVYVTSDKPVTLFSFHFSSVSSTSDGSLVLPEQSLSTQYVISSYHTGIGSQEYLIVATENKTSVTLETESLTQTVTLNRLETYMQTATNISGTMVVSSAPVYVLSGHSCANVANVGACDYIEEAMPSISSLGTVHIVSFMKPRPDFSLSIVATQSNTTAIIYDTYGTILESLSPFLRSQTLFHEYYNFLTISVVSTRPVLITQYGHGSKGIGGDPSMMVIPDVSHFGRQYDFVVPKGFYDPSTITVVISNVYPSSGLLLNGQLFTATQIVSVTVPKFGVYNVLYGNVSVGYNRLTHNATSEITFGAWLYGYKGSEEYAWALGYT